MDLFHKLNGSDDFMNFFCEVLEDIISSRRGQSVCINSTKNQNSIFFFIDGSSILQIMPDKDLQYTYANVPSFQDEIRTAISVVEKQYQRNYKINQLIKK
jgi:hypothetical protein